MSYWNLPGLLLASLLAFTTAGCASAPVQEMSDARQAIRAARDAGAAEKAPAMLDEARSLLASAEAHLEKREFREARDDAVAAHERAVEAMHASEETP
ncbi:MAG TPA: hypothetical protein VLT59_14950 [Steroidobacteraceae bacterium]|nr:hypothetical protein [Steroidobacteraceae bacterium]